MQRKHKGERAQRLFATRQIRDILPTLLWWHYTENDALCKGIQAVNKFKLGIASKRDYL